jgi:hypothetical protein
MGEKILLLERFFDVWLSSFSDRQISEIGSYTLIKKRVLDIP